MPIDKSSMVNAFRAEDAHDLPPDVRQLINRRERVLASPYRLFYETPVRFTRGEGVWMFDPEGHAYLDMYNNVPVVGHCNPAVIDAVHRQAATLNVHTRYLDDVILNYAERLLATFPFTLSRAIFTCTGSEANDLAIRIAKAHTGGTGVIVTDNAYHGVTETIASMSPSLGSNVPLGVAVRTVPVSDPATFGNAVAVAIEDLKRHGYKPAALLVDTIFSSDGVRPDPAGFLKPAAQAIREAGGVFIADEVQAGFGRTGGMWGFSRHDVLPDIVTLGKPMGNGYPIGGVVTSPELTATFGRNVRYFNTFGGSQVACAAGMAVLEEMERRNLLEHVEQIGTRLINGLTELSKIYDCLAAIRGKGLFIGVDIESSDGSSTNAQLASRIVNRLREKRVLVSASGANGDTLKIRPPLVIKAEEVDRFLDLTDQVLRSL